MNSNNAVAMQYKIVKTVRELNTIPAPKDYAKIPEIKKAKPKYACSLRQIENTNIVAWYVDLGIYKKDWRAVSRYFIIEAVKPVPFKKYEEKKRQFILDNVAAANSFLTIPFRSSNKELKEFLKKAKQEIGYSENASLHDVFLYLSRARISIINESLKNDSSRPKFFPAKKSVLNKNKDKI